MGIFNDSWEAIVVITFLTSLIIFLIGYAGGRRQGRREGFNEGIRYAPLELKRRTWEQGRCVLCHDSSADALHPPFEKIDTRLENG